MTTTCINSLQQGGSVGSTCNSSYANHWHNRRLEIVAIGEIDLSDSTKDAAALRLLVGLLTRSVRLVKLKDLEEN